MNGSIKKYKGEQNVAENIRLRLRNIDRKIAEATKALWDAQAIGMKSILSNRTDWLSNLQRNWYVSAANDSANWYKKEIKMLYQERNELQILLDKAEGKFWSNKIKRLLRLVLMGLVLCLMIWIIGLGLLTALYLLPIWACILCVYLIIKKKIGNNRL